MNHVITPVSAHSAVYRGFTITKLPRKAIQPVTRYHVSQGDQSFGKFDAQAQATSYIDGLYQQRDALNKATGASMFKNRNDIPQNERVQLVRKAHGVGEIHYTESAKIWLPVKGKS